MPWKSISYAPGLTRSSPARIRKHYEEATETLRKYSGDTADPQGTHSPIRRRNGPQDWRSPKPGEAWDLFFFGLGGALFAFFGFGGFGGGQGAEGAKAALFEGAIAFELALGVGREPSPGDGVQAAERDGFTGHFAFAVGASLDAFNGLLDLVKGVLVGGEHAEGEI